METWSSVLGLVRFPGGGNTSFSRVHCLENSMDREGPGGLAHGFAGDGHD